IVFGILLMPSLLFAQNNLSDWANVERLKPGTKVIVSTKKGIAWSGQKRQSTDDTLFVEVALPVHGTRTISLTREEIAEVRKGKFHGIVMLLVGAAVGAGVGVAIGSTLDHVGSDDPGLGKLLGGGVGGLAGLTVAGALPRKTKKIYVAP
ncbi:MAG TPA: hypothetical protein VK475_04360, partial [Pyrinomonadaceae bacterium]|nr:hypothetical protein [Pyrinomonadaceae bacterium]